MKAELLIERVMAETEGTFKLTWLLRLNSLIRRFLREGELWSETSNSLTLSITDSDASVLPAYFLSFKKDKNNCALLTLKDAATTVLAPLETDPYTQSKVKLETGVPSTFSVVNKTISFNTLADKAYTLYIEYYRDLTADLVLADVIETKAFPLDEATQSLLIDVLVHWDKNKEELNQMTMDYIRQARYFRAEQTFGAEKFENWV